VRIAIIGFGPKGLYALERLLDHAAMLGPDSHVAVDLFEPHASPAAGPNYDPAQPSYLRMNFAAEHVDMWWPRNRSVPQSERRSLVRWSSSVGETLDGNDYPPRALVGRYLADGFDTLLRHVPPWATLRLRKDSVERVRPSRLGWDVIVAGAVADTYDEVLVATGHVQGSPYPVERWLGPDRIPSGAVVAVRGFALTFIDVALALTEGRGGSFTRLDHPFRLRYVSPPEPIAAILPFSRTGRPMLPKPDPAVASSIDGLGGIADAGRSELMQLEGPIELTRDVLPIIERVANASLAASGARDAAEAGEWLAGAASGLPGTSGLSAYGELERSLAVGSGLVSPDLSWALGQSWGSLYSAIVARLGGDQLIERDWPAFRHLLSELERVTFGPPPINAAKLLALVDAGQVDLTLVAGGEPQADIVVDAVLPGPGVTADSDSVPAQLVADGHARVARFRRGLDVDADGCCRSTDGSPVGGLSSIGRPTEDSVIGNDTLTRMLHPIADRWARRVVDRCRGAGAA
jgi:uncharacterized NAD(P)/FAD-binding protein YdhS